MKKPEKIKKSYISQSIRSLVTIELPAGELDEIIDECDNLCEESYEAGYELGKTDGAIEYEVNNLQINEEKSNSEYVVSMFSDCKNFEDFTNVFNEIRNFSYRFM